MKVCLESDLVSNHLGNFSPKVLAKLTNFFMAHQALSQALLEAKPLGICKITTSINHTDGVISTNIEGSKGMFW